MLFITLNLIVFKNLSEFINFAVLVLLCLIVSEPYYGLVHTFSSKLDFILFSLGFI